MHCRVRGAVHKYRLYHVSLNRSRRATHDNDAIACILGVFTFAAVTGAGPRRRIARRRARPHSTGTRGRLGVGIWDNRAVSVSEHKSHAPASVPCFVLTVSDTRTAETDTSGRVIRELLETGGHHVTGSALVRDDPDQVTAIVRKQLADPATRVIITTGGTGITSRDDTFEAVDRLFEKRLTGFGELFRVLSLEQIGSAAFLSRATAGTVGPKAIFVLPGSESAVRLAMTRLIVPELGHVIQQLNK
jgi:molybdenum cofactor biosynthesis protein B